MNRTRARAIIHIRERNLRLHNLLPSTDVSDVAFVRPQKKSHTRNASLELRVWRQKHKVCVQERLNTFQGKFGGHCKFGGHSEPPPDRKPIHIMPACKHCLFPTKNLARACACARACVRVRAPAVGISHPGWTKDLGKMRAVSVSRTPWKEKRTMSVQAWLMNLQSSHGAVSMASSKRSVFRRWKTRSHPQYRSGCVQSDMRNDSMEG